MMVTPPHIFDIFSKSNFKRIIWKCLSYNDTLPQVSAKFCFSSVQKNRITERCLRRISGYNVSWRLVLYINTTFPYLHLETTFFSFRLTPRKNPKAIKSIIAQILSNTVMEEPPTNSSILKETFTILSTELPTTHRGRGTMDGPGDAVWILTSAFIIFTMISGFGLVESGKCNLTNI